MEFRTIITPDNKDIALRHSDKMMMLGSCFSDNMGLHLADAMINVVINPLGTVYNPMSLAAAVGRITEARLVERGELVEANGVWNCFDFHSRFSMPDADEALRAMNGSITAAHAHLRQCRVLFVTLGTAITYSRGGMVVSNCHKLPQAEFVRQMRSVDEITYVLGAMVGRLREYNPQLRIVFTVSPIRHIADGLATNSLSKSTLRVAVAEMVRKHPDVCSYFPSYEIMMDDLRDYRFYASDMVHPSEVAANYIWEMLKNTYFDAQQQQIILRCERMTKRLRHRPMSQNPEVVAKFKADTQSALDALIAQYPYIAELKKRLCVGKFAYC